MRIPGLLLGMSLVALAGVAASADEMKSGPQPGALIPGTLQVFNATGDRAGRHHCLVCRNGLNPVAALFVRGTGDEPALAELLQKLDAAAARHADVKLGVFAVFLQGAPDEDRTALVEKLKALGMAKELKHVILAVAPDSAVDSYQINPMAGLTVVLYNRHLVRKSFAFPKGEMPAEKDIETIDQAIDAMIPRRVAPPDRPQQKVS